MTCRTGAISCAASLSIRIGIWSGPDALPGFRSNNSFVMPSVTNLMSGIDWC